MKKFALIVLLFTGCSSPKPVKIEAVPIQVPSQIETKSKEQMTEGQKTRRMKQLENQERYLRARQDIGLPY